jgi:hypothetical protein
VTTRNEHLIPREYAETNGRFLVFVEDRPGSGVWRLDPRLFPTQIKLQRDHASQAMISVDLTTGGIEGRAAISIAEAGSAYNRPLGVAIRWMGLGSTPYARGDQKGKPFWLFVGQCDSIEIGWDRKSEGVELIAYGRAALSDESVTPVFGRWMVSPGIDNGDMELQHVFVESLPCGFNFNGRPNRAASFTDERNQRLFTQSGAGQPSMIKVPWFVSDGEANAEWWTYLQAVRYLAYHHAPFAVVDFDDHYKDFADADITAQPLEKGTYAAGKEMLDRLQQRVAGSAGNCQGLGWITALRHLLGGTGVSVAEEIRDTSEELPVHRLVLWIPDTRSFHWLPSHRSNESTAKEFWRKNQVQSARIFWDRARTFNRVLGLGGPKEYEVTVELQPNWIKDANWADDDVDSQLTALTTADTAIHTTMPDVSDDPSLWTTDPWLSKHHPRGVNFEANLDTGRLWSLNEDGRIALDATRRFEHYIFGQPGGGLENGNPVPGWPVSDDVTRTNCDSIASGFQIVDRSGTGWEDAQPGDSGVWDSDPGPGNPFTIADIQGDTLFLSPFVVPINTGKTVVILKGRPLFPCIRPRRFLPTVTTDGRGNPLRPFIEISFDLGTTWEPAGSIGLTVENLSESCSIRFSGRGGSLHEVFSSRIRYVDVSLPSGYTPPPEQEYVSFFSAYVLGTLRVRATAAVESDRLVAAHAFQKLSSAAADRWESMQDVSEFVFRNRNSGNSRFDSVIATTRAVDDTQRLFQQSQRLLQERGVTSFSGQFVIPWIDVGRFHVGDSIRGVQGVGAGGLSGQAWDFLMVKPGGGARYPTIHSIVYRPQNGDTTIALEDLRLGGV